MKIKNPNAGALTNFEVLDFLKARGAGKDSSRVIAPVAPSEYKVYDYLMETPACRQTREQINEFMEKCKAYKLAKAEILNIINIVPRELVELDPIIEKSEVRFGDLLEEVKDLVCDIFPPPPGEPAAEEGGEEDHEERN
ncbi:DNA-directed RNA polymerase III subunit RPC9 isoform X1 [Ricinus communis]|uniref:DNA-directed RNA polymerase III subunit RPC9 isoform X1 n=1 Tax=Ricinus communis TaxID=3988 RepID=UPI0007726132|nr:DNA-directed RNA polymerase III subunit RPC9 isoform X1 [Ricinus communis]|eukprot:XP_002525535.2 DNA-directed RNA polymerase III subunit RPC9 [Ricinus communis]